MTNENKTEENKTCVKCTCDKCNTTMPLLEMHEIALNTRNLEIGMFWTRSNYFLVLNTALGFGFISLVKDIKIGASLDTYTIYLALLLCGIGVFICFAWLKVNLGSKFWQSHWEEILCEVGNNMKLEIIGQKDGINYFKSTCHVKKRVDTNLNRCNKCQCNKDKYGKCQCNKGKMFKTFHNNMILTKPSVSNWMTLLSLFFLVIWFGIGAFIAGSHSCYFLIAWFILWLLFWLVIEIFNDSDTLSYLICIIMSIAVLGILGYKIQNCLM